jgi:hypothetical protein
MRPRIRFALFKWPIVLLNAMATPRGRTTKGHEFVGRLPARQSAPPAGGKCVPPPLQGVLHLFFCEGGDT